MANFNPPMHQIPEDGRPAEIFRRLSILERSHSRDIPDPVPVGAIVCWPSDTPPEDFVLCDGRSIAVDQHEDLFELIGYSYGGSGNSFNVPDYSGRLLIGRDSSESDINSLGEERGEWDHDHVASNHSHGSDGAHTHDSAGSHSHPSSGGTHSHDAAGGHQHGVGDSEHIHQQGDTDDGGSHSHTSASEFTSHGHGISSGTSFSQGVILGSTGAAAVGHDHLTGIDSFNHSHSLTSSGSAHDHGNPDTNPGGSHTHPAVSDHTHSSVDASHSHGSAGAHTHSSSNHNHGTATEVENTTTGNPPWFSLYYAIKARHD